MKDGLASGEFKAEDITLTGSIITPIGSIATIQAGETIAAAEIEAGAITAAKQGFVGKGSPATFGIVAEVGKELPDATGSTWINFQEPFATNPYIIATPEHATATAASVKTIHTASALIMSAATGSFHWLAIGSR